MMKRALSLLLCLIMVLGMIPMTAQAAETSDIVYLDESMSMSDLVDQGIVVMGDSEEEEPYTVPFVPTVPQVPTQTGPQIPMEKDESVDVQSSNATDCDCGMGNASLYSHSDACARKLYYISVCASSAENIYGRWLTLGADNRQFLEDYMAVHYPDTLVEFYAIHEAAVYMDYESDPAAVDAEPVEPSIDGPTGEASATVDGVTVDAVGLPEGSSLTVQAPTSDVLDAVKKAVSKVEANEQLFVYDISVQNEESDNWQPKGSSVELTLTLPGAEKLPKYTPVKIIHVDDNGQASTIDAYVGEGGKVVFTTSGFSTFAGFTVDFAYDGVEFSIDGLSSIKLSEIFDKLKMPLDAANVIDLVYTDNTQIKIEKLDGDWLLTSLKAFDTEEKLTLTLADGNVYSIKVTDATTDQADCYFAYRHNVNTSSGQGNGMTKVTDGYGSIDEKNNGGNGFVRLYLNTSTNGKVGSGDGSVDGTADKSGLNDYWYMQPVIFDGKGRENAEFTLSLRRNSQSPAAGSTFYLKIWHWYIIGGAQVTINVGGPNTTDGDGFKKGDKIIIQTYHETPSKYEYEHMIEIGNGSLELLGDSSNNIQIVLDGSKTLTTSNSKIPIRLGGKATKLICRNVTFKNAPSGAILNGSAHLTEFTLRKCTFESTVNRSSGSYYGGAIYLYSENDGAEQKIDTLKIQGCTFDGNKAGNSGGAIFAGDYIGTVAIEDYVYTDTTGSKDKSVTIRTTFDGCESGHRGGAICFQGSFGKVKIDADFIDCKADRDGGAIFLDSNLIRNTGHYGRMHTLNLTNSNFTRCIAKGTYDDDDTSNGVDKNKPNTWYAGSGGGVFIGIEVNNVNVTNCTFNACDAKGGYVNLAGAGICFGYTNVGTGYGSEYSGSAQKPFLDATDWEKTNGYTPRTKTYGMQSSGKWVQRTTMGAVTVQNCTFKNTTAATHQGGAFIVRTGASMESLTVTGTTVQSCTVRDKGSAIFLNNCIIGTTKFTDCIFKNCVVKDGCYTGGGTLRTVGKTSTVMTIENCQFLDNKGNVAGGGIYWNAGRTAKTPDGKEHGETKVTVKNSQFRRNTALSTGANDYHENESTGAYYEVTPNYFSRFGGAIFCETKMELQGCTFEANKSDLGGAICMSVYNSDYRQFGNGEVTQLNLDSASSFYDNQAINGGAIAIRANPSLAIENGKDIEHTIRFTLGGAKVYNNVATNNGGGIHYKTEISSDPDEVREVENYIKEIILDSGTIYNNTAGKHGAGVYMESNSHTSVTFGDATDSTKFATIYGNHAGLSRTDASVSIDTALNTATNKTGGDGGGIYLSSTDATVDIYGGYIGAYLDDDNQPVAAGNNAYFNSTPGKTNSGNGGGMAILGSATVNMTGGYIANNVAETDGGAIRLTRPDAVNYNNCVMTLQGGTMKSNIAGDDGGAVYISGQDATMNLYDGTIQSNTAAVRGGGIYLSARSKMYLYGGTCESNTSGNYGGGICLSDNTIMEIYGGTIQKNNAVKGGGIALCGKGATLTMDPRVIVKDDKEVTTYGLVNENIASMQGGGIYLEDVTSSANVLTINQGTVSKNKATESNGGGIVVGKYNLLYFNNGDISENECGAWGGGIYVGGNSWDFDGNTSGHAYLTGGNIHDNKASTGAGLCAQNDGQIHLDGSSVYDNEASEEGGAIYATYSSIFVTKGTLTGNIAGISGGAISSTASKTVIEGGSISQNTAPNGGALCLENYHTSKSTLSITNGSIYGNSATSYGGAMYLFGSDASITGGKIYGNTSTCGGAIFMNKCETNDVRSELTLTDGKIYQNTVIYDDNGGYGHGGAIYSVNSKITMEGGELHDNHAMDMGGAIYANGSETIVTNGKLYNNRATNLLDPDAAGARGYGGAMYIYGGSIDISGGEMTNNVALAHAGAAYMNGATVTISNGLMSGNAATYGGALFLLRATTTITGGIIGTTADVIENDVVIEKGKPSNRAHQGAGIFIRSGNTIINGGTIIGNTVQDYADLMPEYDKHGGGITIDNHDNNGMACVVEINGGSITGNIAPQGGGIRIRNIDAATGYNVTCTITGGEITNNTSTGDGGGIYIDGAGAVGVDDNGVVDDVTSLTMNGGRIENNTAGGNGGGVWTGNRAQVSILATDTTHGEITKNTASNGGGVYVIGGANLVVTNGYITFNKAIAQYGCNLDTARYDEEDEPLAGVGGGVFVAAGIKNVANSTFTLTSATGKNEMAIYGNLADFAADDVFAIGTRTQLTIPTVAKMDLAGFGFAPEGWFEDYPKGDVMYANGLNMITANGSSPAYDFKNVYRYRDASTADRLLMHINPDNNGNNYVEGAKDAEYLYVNKAGTYVCMTLGIPGASDDTVVVDYGLDVKISLLENDLFISDEDLTSTGKLGNEMPTDKPDFKFYQGVYYSKNDNPEGTFEVAELEKLYGTATINNNGTLTYSQKNSMAGQDEMCYVVNHKGVWYYANITVIPATTIYFEDNYKTIQYHTQEEALDANGNVAKVPLASWDPITDAVTDTQDQDRPGASILAGLDANNIYGYDGKLAATETYSNGTAHHVTVRRHYGVDDNSDGKCDECGLAVQFTHAFDPQKNTNKCKVCLNPQDKHGTDDPQHK